MQLALARLVVLPYVGRQRVQRRSDCSRLDWREEGHLLLLRLPVRLWRLWRRRTPEHVISVCPLFDATTSAHFGSGSAMTYLLFKFSRRMLEPRSLGSASSLLRAALRASCTFSDRTLSAMVLRPLNPCVSRVDSRWCWPGGRRSWAGMRRIACSRLLRSVRVCICVRKVVISDAGVAGTAGAGVATAFAFSDAAAVGGAACEAGTGGGGISSDAVLLGTGTGPAVVADGVLLIVVGGEGVWFGAFAPHTGPDRISDREPDLEALVGSTTTASDVRYRSFVRAYVMKAQCSSVPDSLYRLPLVRYAAHDALESPDGGRRSQKPHIVVDKSPR